MIKLDVVTKTICIKVSSGISIHIRCKVLANEILIECRVCYNNAINVRDLKINFISA